MFYVCELSKITNAVSNTARRMRGKVPAKLTEDVELPEELRVYFDAFWDLDSDRSHAMGWMRIPWSSIARYAEFYGFDEEQSERLNTHIRAMDTANIERLEANRPKGK